MKIFRIFGLQVRYFFSVRRVKRLTFDLPDWADDIFVSSDDIKFFIKYYNGSEPFYIDLPKCSDAVVVNITPYAEMVDDNIIPIKNRKIIVDVFN